MDKCQDSGVTCYNRHPDIFAQAKALLPTSPVSVRVLSFGCSSGEEVQTLRNLGASHWQVDGAESNPDLLAKARAADPKGLYVPDARVLPTNSYDAIFCMSVLCRFQSPPTDFPFSTFERVLGCIIDLLRPGGILIIYNAQYDPRETIKGEIFLEALPGKVFGGSGFVPKYTKDMRTEIPASVAKAVPYLYRKRRQES
jgi:SAM-dependent methyltransferase